MSRKLILVLALAFVLGLSVAAFAEVQNVKISGDITVMPFSRNHLDLGSGEDTKYATGIIGLTNIDISANLTDNVDAVVAFSNERLWSTLSNDSGTISPSSSDTDGVYLSKAYVSLKDFLKESTGVPLTLVIGRQPLRLGSGLLIGDPDTNQYEWSGNFQSGARHPIGDFSIRKSFDGVAGVLDYNPLSITLGYVKGYRGSMINKDDDINVWAAVAAYNFGEDYKNLVGELTFVKQNVVTYDDVNNYGVRFTAMPVKDLGMEVEYVYQTATKYGVFDDNFSGTLQDDDKSRASDAFRLNGTMAFPDMKLTPSIGVDYTRLSKYWNVMHEDMTPAPLMNLIFPNQDVSVIGATVTLKPMKDLTAKWRYANATMAKKADGSFDFSSLGTQQEYLMTGKKELGYEIDSAWTYDYTSDVQFGVTFGMFKPGKAFDESNRKTANQLVGSMKVTF